jgi:methionyl aminopeptidase
MGVPTVILYSPGDIQKIRVAGRAAAGTLSSVGERIAPGITTAEIDAWVREDTKNRGGIPSQLGFEGFPAAVCTSRNEVVCHGIPSPLVVLRDGDIVNVDVTTEVAGYHGDTSRTFFVGSVSEDARHVTEAARRALHAGIAVVRDGARVGDIGAAIADVAREAGCSVVRELCGHGIGRKMHESPQIPHDGKAGSGIRLKTGMVFTIEPMLNLGAREVRFLDDGWTVVTADGSLSAQFEHTIAVTKDGAEILTPAP